MRTAAALLFPSVWYEGMPLTLIEAFAAGLPVIASRLGAMAAMVADGRTGILVAPGNAGALAEAITRAATDGPGLAAMGAAARADYVETYSPGPNYARLADIYRAAVARRRGTAAA
jgi:glycosyltransferase involved in cell wall biosynthesis